MPTVYFNCPQCDRPLDADTALDGPVIECPCCDRVIEVPRPRALGRPVVVWLAAATLILTPAAALPGLLQFIEAIFVVPVVLAGTLGCLVPAVGLVRGKRAAWVAALVLGSPAFFAGGGGVVLALPFVFAGLMSTDLFAVGGLVAACGVGLAVLLFLPSCRAWCDG